MAGMGGAERAALFLHRLEGFEERIVVIEQAARVVVDEQLQMRQPILQRQDLVDLLLILGHHHRDFRVIEHIGELAGDRVLAGRHGDPAQAHRGELREIEPRPILADHRQLVALPKARRGEPEREVADLLPVAPPAVGLPDAEVLLAQRGAVRHALGIAPQQLRQGRADRHAACSRA